MRPRTVLLLGLGLGGLVAWWAWPLLRLTETARALGLGPTPEEERAWGEHFARQINGAL